MMKGMLFGSAIGMMAGIGLMMTPAARSIRRDVKMGMRKARKMMNKMDMR